MYKEKELYTKRIIGFCITEYKKGNIYITGCQKKGDVYCITGYT